MLVFPLLIIYMNPFKVHIAVLLVNSSTNSLEDGYVGTKIVVDTRVTDRDVHLLGRTVWIVGKFLISQQELFLDIVSDGVLGAHGAVTFSRGSEHG